MGSGYKDDASFAFYDPEQDREGHGQAPRNSPAPVTQSPREQPFGHYDPELDGEGGRFDTSYGPGVRTSPSGLNRRDAGRGAPPPPYINQDSGTLPMSNGNGRGAPELGSAGRGAPEPGYRGRGAPEPGYGGRGAPELGNGGRGAPGPEYGGRGAPEPGYGGRGAPELGNGGRGGPEAGYGGRGAPPPNQDFAGVSGRGRGYGNGESGYPKPGRPAQMDDDLGRGRSSGVQLGAGKYVYGGLQQPDEANFEQDGTPPAPISSEYAHQTYASVFSDPVYGGARQLNAHAGYAEEPEDLQRLHHKEDVLRHPDQF